MPHGSYAVYSGTEVYEFCNSISCRMIITVKEAEGEEKGSQQREQSDKGNHSEVGGEGTVGRGGGGAT